MANIKVWCLLIDHDLKPTFGEPFPVAIRSADEVHDLKTKIRQVCDKIYHLAPNEVEIWKCKSIKLSAIDSFGLTKKQLNNFKFSDDENSDVDHLGAAREMIGLGLQYGELLLAVVPRRAGTRCSFLCSTFLAELPT